MNSCFRRSAETLRHRLRSGATFRTFSSTPRPHCGTEAHESSRIFQEFLERSAFKKAQQQGRFSGSFGFLSPVLKEVFYQYHTSNACRQAPQAKPESSSSPVFVACPHENENASPLPQWLLKLWLPLVLVITVYTSYRHPIAMIVHLLVLIWGSKPRPSSIHEWIEKRQMKAANEKTGLDRLKDQLNFSLVKHIHVEDHFLFCLARVSSLTESTVLLGFFGDWWVLHSTTVFLRY